MFINANVYSNIFRVNPDTNHLQVMMLQNELYQCVNTSDENDLSRTIEHIINSVSELSTVEQAVAFFDVKKDDVTILKSYLLSNVEFDFESHLNQFNVIFVDVEDSLNHQLTDSKSVDMIKESLKSIKYHFFDRKYDLLKYLVDRFTLSDALKLLSIFNFTKEDENSSNFKRKVDKFIKPSTDQSALKGRGRPQRFYQLKGEDE